MIRKERASKRYAVEIPVLSTHSLLALKFTNNLRLGHFKVTVTGARDLMPNYVADPIQ